MKLTSTGKDATNLSVTIYNKGFGVVREERTISLNNTIDQVQYLDVAEKIETNSIIVKGLQILELNYDYDLVSKEKLLEKYLDHNVWIANKDDQIEYRLLSVAGGMVLENVMSKEIVISPEGQLILPSLPNELNVRPALNWKVRPTESSSIQVSYITSGIEWAANYVIDLSPETLKLSGWVDVQNHSGATYENANVKLIAGEVKRVQQVDPYEIEDGYVLYDAAPAPNIEEKSFADYHMYTIQNKTTLKQNQSKQINFLELEHIPYKKYYEVKGWSENPQIILEIENNAESGMGIPLPAGIVKVYQEDVEDIHAEFIGEDEISHLPKNEMVRLFIGEAFDLKCEGRVLDRRKKGRYEYVDYQYEIRNHKNTSGLLKIPHYISGVWEMVDASDTYEKDSAGTIVFWIDMAPESRKTVTFTYRIDNGVTIVVDKK